MPGRSVALSGAQRASFQENQCGGCDNADNAILGAVPVRQDVHPITECRGQKCAQRHDGTAMPRGSYLAPAPTRGDSRVLSDRCPRDLIRRRYCRRRWRSPPRRPACLMPSPVRDFIARRVTDQHPHGDAPGTWREDPLHVRVRGASCRWCASWETSSLWVVGGTRSSRRRRSGPPGYISFTPTDRRDRPHRRRYASAPHVAVVSRRWLAVRLSGCRWSSAATNHFSANAGGVHHVRLAGW